MFRKLLRQDLNSGNLMAETTFVYPNFLGVIGDSITYMRVRQSSKTKLT